ncbi:MAG: SDR family NAD(P)-dependent oxidoreductase [Dehalococcoidia bacterium]|nr:SDR family NAD(P)-dependent oxidoreductase [Dehalococcoidia bacterium]
MDNNFSLEGKTAVVTGSSRGLGAYMAEALARAGADVVITSRTIASLDDTRARIESIGRKAIPTHSLM